MPPRGARDDADLALETPGHQLSPPCAIVDGLDLGVGVERVRPELAAVAALLEAAERRRDPHRAVRVDREVAALERPRDAQRLRAVARPDRARQPVDRVVGEADRLGLVVERDHARDRAEDLLGRRAVAGVDRVQHGRREPVARARRARCRGSRPARRRGRTTATVSRWPAEISGPISVASSSGSPTRIASTAVLAVASRNASTALALDEDPRARAAVLAGVVEHRAGRRRAPRASTSASAKTMFADLPPSSSVTRLIVPAAAARRSTRPTSVEPVKAILPTSGCSTSRCPQVRPGPGDDVHDALGHAGLERELARSAARSAASARPA